MAFQSINAPLATTARAQVLSGLIGGGAVIKLFTGAPPADPSMAVSGTLLATLSCGQNFGSVTSGQMGGAPAVLSGSAAQGPAVAAGTPGMLRICNAGGVGIVDMDVTSVGGGGSVQINPAAVTSGATLQISSIVIKESL